MSVVVTGACVTVLEQCAPIMVMMHVYHCCSNACQLQVTIAICMRLLWHGWLLQLQHDTNIVSTSQRCCLDIPLVKQQCPFAMWSVIMHLPGLCILQPLSMLSMLHHSLLQSYLQLATNCTALTVFLSMCELLWHLSCLIFLWCMTQWLMFTGVVVTLARKYRVKLPVLTAVAQVLNGHLNAKEAVYEIMNLPQIEER